MKEFSIVICEFQTINNLCFVFKNKRNAFQENHIDWLIYSFIEKILQKVFFTIFFFPHHSVFPFRTSGTYLTPVILLSLKFPSWSLSNIIKYWSSFCSPTGITYFGRKEYEINKLMSVFQNSKVTILPPFLSALFNASGTSEAAEIWKSKKMLGKKGK